MPHQAFIVTRNGREIDTVFATHPNGYSAQEATDDVRDGLINHDGYPSNIVVRRRSSGHTSPALEG